MGSPLPISSLQLDCYTHPLERCATWQVYEPRSRHPPGPPALPHRKGEWGLWIQKAPKLQAQTQLPPSLGGSDLEVWHGPGLSAKSPGLRGEARPPHFVPPRDKPAGEAWGSCLLLMKSSPPSCPSHSPGTWWDGGGGRDAWDRTCLTRKTISAPGPKPGAQLPISSH